MKKRIFAFITCALLLCTAALSAAYAFAADDVVTTTSASTADRPHPWELAPKTDNAGYLLNDISVYDFTKYGFGRGYGSNLTRSQGYGEYTVDGNDMFFTTNCGGDLGSFVHVYAANGANLTDATWVRFYVDCTDLVCGGKTGVGINLYLANGAKMADSNAGALLPFFVKDGATAFIRQSGASEWTSQKISNSFVYVDEGFTGYVAFPISAFKHGAEEGKKEMTNVSTFASAVKNGYKYLCRVTLRFDIADGKESGTLMFIDDLTFSEQGEKHQHTFASKGTYGADCLNGGIELLDLGVQDVSGILLVGLNTDVDLVNAKALGQQRSAQDDLIGTLQAGAVVARDVGLALSGVDDDVVHLAKTGRDLHMGGERCAALTNDTGVLHDLHQFLARQIFGVSHRLDLFAHGVLEVVVDNNAHHRTAHRTGTGLHSLDRAGHAGVDGCGNESAGFADPLSNFYLVAHCNDGFARCTDVHRHGNDHLCRRCQLLDGLFIGCGLHVIRMNAAKESMCHCLHLILTAFITALARPFPPLVPGPRIKPFLRGYLCGLHHLIRS